MVEKGGIFWEGGVDTGRVAYINWLKGGIFWEGGVDSRRVAHINWLKRKRVYPGREGKILGGSHNIIVVAKEGKF